MSILVADDAPHVRKLVRMIFEPAHHVIEAEDGDQALQLLEAHLSEVAILDVSMPGQTGIEVCRKLRQHRQLASTGVIVITANGAPTDLADALDAGADYFLTKPFSPAVLVQLVDAMLTARAGRSE